VTGKRTWLAGIGAGKIVNLVVLSSWATFFAYLWITHAVSSYLGPRTQWVVVFGAIVLSLCVILQIAGLRRSHGPMSRSDAAGAVAMLLPLLVLIAVPNATLGSTAASQKAVGAAGGLGAAPVPSAGAGSNPSFIDIHYASQSASYALKSGVSVNDEVDLTGFVTHKQRFGTFSLTRFYVYCCLADAIPYSVDVISDPKQDYPDNTWLEVKGRLVRAGNGLAVRPLNIKKVAKPNPPYLF
jgi:uncharacterized repeat protein (TIGR03943 family)